MSAAGIFDVLAVFGFGVAATSFAISGREFGRRSVANALMLLAMLVLVFVALTNSLEHLGITDALDPLEDYVEVLFFPLIGYGLFAKQSTQQIEHLRMTQRASKAEHDLLMSIVDTSPVGIAVVDARGCLPYANKYAWDTLHLIESHGVD